MAKAVVLRPANQFALEVQDASAQLRLTARQIQEAAGFFGNIGNR
jgi:hypothetical protein